MICRGWELFRPIFWGLLFVFILNGAQAAEPRTGGIVSWVYDGDTLQVDGIGKVRLLGIDVPERENSPRDDYLRRQGVDRTVQRRIAKEALKFVIAEVKGKQVRLQLDEEHRDRHGRLLAYVFLPGGRNLNRLLLERGYAAVYRRFTFRLKEDFILAETEARRQRLGLWRK